MGSGERTARWVIGLWAALWIAHDSLPYLGGRDDSCQTMFSSQEWGVGPDGTAWNNHLVLPQRMLFDAWVVLDLREVTIVGEPRDARERGLVRWLTQTNRAFSLEATRVALAQLCEHHRVSLSYRQRLVVPTGSWGPRGPLPREPFVSLDDACGEAWLTEPHAWIPVRLYETDFPITPDSEEAAADAAERAR